MRMGDPSDLGNRLDAADLIVGKHHCDQDGIRADRRLKFIQLQPAVFIDINIADLIAPLFQVIAGMKDRMMFDF